MYRILRSEAVFPTITCPAGPARDTRTADRRWSRSPPRRRRVRPDVDPAVGRASDTLPTGRGAVWAFGLDIGASGQRGDRAGHRGGDARSAHHLWWGVSDLSLAGDSVR